MITGKTSTGFEFEIDENVINDMRILDAVSEVANETNLLAISFLVDTILGENKERLYKHVAEKNGRVPIDKVNSEIAEIFKAFGGAGKNS